MRPRPLAWQGFGNRVGLSIIAMGLNLIFALMLCRCGDLAWNTSLADAPAVRRAMIDSVKPGITSKAQLRTGAQPVDATHALKRSAGVSCPSVFRGRSLRCLATALSFAWLCIDKSVPFGKYCRCKRLVFSFVPRLSRYNPRGQNADRRGAKQPPKARIKHPRCAHRARYNSSGGKQHRIPKKHDR